MTTRFAARTRRLRTGLARALCAVGLLVAGLDRAAAAPLRVAVISDLNGAYGATRYDPPVDAAVRRIVELKPDLVISTGDMVAGQRRPHLSHAEVEAMWRAFHAHVSEPLAGAGIPLAVTPGNHDGSAYGGFEAERQAYAEQWNPRKPAVRFIDDARYPFHYAFAVGTTLFVSLDATVVGHLPREQLDWLRGLLAQHGGEFAQRVAFSHMPLWPFARGREADYIGDPIMEGLLKAADVGLYLSGHHHAFYPGHKDGILHVSQACLGADPRRLIGTAQRAPRTFTLIELADTERRIAAYREPDFTRPVDWHTLPAGIHSAAAVLVRADLVGTEVETLPMAGDSHNMRRP